MLKLLRLGVLHYLSKCHVLIFLSFMISLPAVSQPEQVCIGTKSVFAANGDVGSIFDYSLEQQEAGRIIQTYPDTITVEWYDLKGIFQLGVRETSQHGCIGNWEFIDVEVVGEYAQFTQPFYTICNNGGVLVDFNKSDFQYYSWLDSSVSPDGYISKPGFYELITVDHNNCVLSSFIEVIENPFPKISLGDDRMICSSTFELHALDVSDNPYETIYTWSTGDNGELVTYIRVTDHDITEDKLFWVLAEYDGCIAGDSIIIFACDEDIPEPFEGKIPNTFTPNDDGDNDVWNISALIEYPECVVEVFDRWGRKVFMSEKGYPVSWDGKDTNGRILPMETYFYVITLNDGVSKKPLRGTITIIR